jgi:Ribonuclease G/E
MAFAWECGIRKRIEDLEERDRLKDNLYKLTFPEGMGVIIRTAEIGKKCDILSEICIFSSKNERLF